jgi:protein-tyrosine-phosphatase
VDNHNSGPSILAEAAAAVLAPEGFIFSSAGLDPHPITASTVAFLNGIGGCDAARFYPKSINQVPHLDHYQVIIGLDKHARQAFPPRPQKLVFLEWPTNDPAELEGEPLEVKAAHEAVFKELDAHLRDLVFALAGKPKGAKT